MVVSFERFSSCRVVLFLIYIVVASGLMLLGSSPSSADEQTAEDAPKPTGQDRYFENSIGVKLKLIPSGSFTMGDDNGHSDEKPVHQVTLSKPFMLGVHEVTQAELSK